MTRHDDTTRLRHMLDYAREASDMAQGHSRHDLDILWAIVQNDLPPLIEELQRILGT